MLHFSWLKRLTKLIQKREKSVMPTVVTSKSHNAAGFIVMEIHMVKVG